MVDVEARRAIADLAKLGLDSLRSNKEAFVNFALQMAAIQKVLVEKGLITYAEVERAMIILQPVMDQHVAEASYGGKKDER